jgi:hypothetical protein
VFGHQLIRTLSTTATIATTWSRKIGGRAKIPVWTSGLQSRHSAPNIVS